MRHFGSKWLNWLFFKINLDGADETTQAFLGVYKNHLMLRMASESVTFTGSRFLTEVIEKYLLCREEPQPGRS